MIRAIGTSRRRKAVSALLARFSDRAAPFGERLALVEALGELGYREAAAPLSAEWERLLGSAPEPDLDRLRAAVVRALGKTAEKGGAGALAAVRRGMLDRSREVSAAAIESAGRLQDEESIGRLSEFLKGDDEVRSAAAAGALAAIGGAGAEELLRERLASAPPRGRVDAAFALARLGRKIGVLTLDGFLEEVAGPYPDGIAAAGALAALERTQGIAYLVSIVNAGPGEHFDAAVRALGESGSPRAILPLADLLGRPEASVRAAAVAALGGVGGDRAAFELRRKKDDPDPALREEIRRTRALLGDYVLP